LCDELQSQIGSLGIIPAADLEKYAREAEEAEGDLESILKKHRVLNDTNLQALRSMRESATYCNLSDFLPNLSNSALIPEELVRRHVMYPLFDLDGLITLVMEDPGDLAAIDQVRRQTKKEVEVCQAARTEVLGLIERAYGATTYLSQSSVSDALADASISEGVDESQPVIRLVDDLISQAIRQGASDIHIEPGDTELRIRIRVDGVLRDVGAPQLGLHKALVSRIKIMSRLDISKTRSPQDGACPFRSPDTEVILRVSVLPSVFGEAVVLRILRNGSEALGLEEIGMEPHTLERFDAVIQNAHGMILVSGPTGSGKSTTLYAAVKRVVSPKKNIIAIEDPVEYRTSLIRQVQVNTEADLTFASGLRSVLRQDPDVIMVGEIRDKETAQISVQAALTGHLVLSTVHTNDSVSAVARLRDLGVAEYLISSSLLSVLAQRLCRRNCPECTAVDSPSPLLLKVIGLEPGKLDFEPKRGRGCRRCVGTGYVGRLGLYELFEMTEGFAEMIVRKEPTEVLRSKARQDGMRFLVHDGIEKLRRGVTSVEEVARVAGRS
jgi:type IV pilus assembly protein PilB